MEGRPKQVNAPGAP
jgi:hypothetical protein